MKVNSVGINAYQQVANSAIKRGQANGSNDSVPAKFTVQPQNASGPSRISVRPRIAESGTVMNQSEKNALNNLLKVIGEKSSAKSVYGKDNRAVENPDFVGKFVDVKV